MRSLTIDQKEQRIHGKSHGSYLTELLFHLIDNSLEKAIDTPDGVSDKNNHAFEIVYSKGFKYNFSMAADRAALSKFKEKINRA